MHPSGFRAGPPVVVASSVMAFACAAAGPSGPAPAPSSVSSTARPVEVIGHRGARAARPENTLAAFEYALQAGADAIELDLAVTRDDRLVVVHDLLLNIDLCRGPDGQILADRVPIRAMSFDEVRRLDCGAVRNPRFPGQVPVPGQRIPAIEEVLSLLRESPLPAVRTARLVAEMKSDPSRPDLGPDPDRAADLLVAAVRGSGIADRITVQSFDHRVLRAVHARDPSIPLAALVGRERTGNPVEIVRAADAGIFAPHHEGILAGDVAVLHAAGMRVTCWTANGPAAWDRLLGMGVDGIITDDPAGLIAHLRARGLRPACP